MNARLKYKLAIRKAFLDFENDSNDDITQHFLNKKIPDFWKSWSRKMHRNVEKDVFVNGSSEGSDVANTFADVFESIYFDSSSDLGAKNEFINLFQDARSGQSDGHNINYSITVELVESAQEN